MATGRTVGSKYTRVYIDGYDVSGFTRSVGALNWGFNENTTVVLDDAVTGALPGRGNIEVGDVNSVLDNTSDSLHDALAGNSDNARDVMIPLGIRAAPTEGDPTFVAQVTQNAYQAEASDGIVTATLDLGSWDRRADSFDYAVPWGNLLHAKGAETGANSADASDYDHGSQTTSGGYMMYQVFSSDGTVAIKVEDADTESDASYSELLTSGDVDASSSPKSGIVVLGTGATVERYLRWQIALNTATTVTFALSFHRGY
jgi:hypothetical protein